MLGYMHALLLIGVNTHQLIDVNERTTLQWAEPKGQPTTTELFRQHTAPPQPTDASPAALSDAAEPVVSPPPASLPVEIYHSAGRGELRMVIKWLRKGGSVDALYPASTVDGHTATFGLLHAAARHGHLEMASVLLKRGASVDLQTNQSYTALMAAAGHGHLSVMLILLQHSAKPDLQDVYGQVALMKAAHLGHEACVRALLQAGANTELRTKKGLTALLLAEDKGHTATAKLIRQHASCLSLGLGLALCCTVVPLAWPWVVLSVVLGAMATVAFSRALLGVGGRHRAARQRRPHRPSRRAKAHGRTNTAETTQQHAAPSQVPRADAAMEKPLAEEAVAQAKEQAPSKMSKKKKKKADRAAAAGDEPSGAPPASAPALPLAAAPEPAVLAAEQAETALRAAGCRRSRWHSRRRHAWCRRAARARRRGPGATGCWRRSKRPSARRGRRRRQRRRGWRWRSGRGR